MKPIRRIKTLLAAVGLCAVLVAVAVASMHVDSIASDHVTAHCAACHVARACAAADSCDGTTLHRPSLAAEAVFVPLQREPAPARTRALGSRAPPAA